MAGVQALARQVARGSARLAVSAVDLLAGAQLMEEQQGLASHLVQEASGMTNLETVAPWAWAREVHYPLDSLKADCDAHRDQAWTSTKPAMAQVQEVCLWEEAAQLVALIEVWKSPEVWQVVIFVCFPHLNELMSHCLCKHRQGFPEL